MSMTFAQRLAAIRARLHATPLDCVVALHDGAHFIEKPDPVMVLTGFKALGTVAAVLDRAGAVTLVVTPSWDSERAREACPSIKIVPADDVIAGLQSAIGSGIERFAIGVAGLTALPHGIARRLTDLVSQGHDAEAIVFEPAQCKTDTELAHVREATRIAELGYKHLLEVARPGMTEDELAMELRWHSKSLGAEDNFVLLCAGPHNKAVAPSNGRRMQAGDIIVCEITPSYRGQLAQICRTIVLGEAAPVLRKKYQLIISSMNAGFAAAVPGATMAGVCQAMNAVLEAEGYGEFCHPPHIRRRGHGLGFGATGPGDVALDNATALEPDMLFMIHPNQYLPETGYLLCGEPAVLTPQGARALTREQAALAEIAL
ncbi:MAG TPA: M24 family metallopeptidase [Xanthobacteraceae bacterium]|jgi:Xaa-Pro aminopeptidase|nr:M24 family metallopeptidase [Xanthobacteraceae bacterium]